MPRCTNIGNCLLRVFFNRALQHSGMACHTVHLVFCRRAPSACLAGFNQEECSQRTVRSKISACCSRASGGLAAVGSLNILRRRLSVPRDSFLSICWLWRLSRRNRPVPLFPARCLRHHRDFNLWKTDTGILGFASTFAAHRQPSFSALVSANISTISEGASGCWERKQLRNTSTGALLIA